MQIDTRALAARGCPLDLFTGVAAALGDRWVTPECMTPTPRRAPLK